MHSFYIKNQSLSHDIFVNIQFLFVRPPPYTQEEKTSDYHLIEGKFISPLELYIPGLAPVECQQAQFQMLLPLKWADETYKPICVQFAGTGDHVSRVSACNS